MNNRTFNQHPLWKVQNDLAAFAYKLTADREEANDLLPRDIPESSDSRRVGATPATNFSGWIYTIMRTYFYQQLPRKVVRDQTFVDTTDNLII